MNVDNILFCKVFLHQFIVSSPFLCFQVCSCWFFWVHFIIVSLCCTILKQVWNMRLILNIRHFLDLKLLYKCIDAYLYVKNSVDKQVLCMKNEIAHISFFPMVVFISHLCVLEQLRRGMCFIILWELICLW